MWRVDRYTALSRVLGAEIPKLIEPPSRFAFVNPRLTQATACYDQTVRLETTPIALVSLVDANRQWFKSKVGLDVPESTALGRRPKIALRARN